MKALKNICAISLLLGATAFTSCTDLTEEIHSSVIAENYYNNAGEVMAAMMRPWGHFCGTMQVAQSPWSCNGYLPTVPHGLKKVATAMTMETGFAYTAINGFLRMVK